MFRRSHIVAGKSHFTLATGSPGELGLLKLLHGRKVDMAMGHAPPTPTSLRRTARKS